MNNIAPYDILGTKIGKLTVCSVIKKDENNRYKYLCECDCGELIQVRRNDLIGNNHINSCGCLKEENARTDIIGNTYKCFTVSKFDHMEYCKAANGVTQNKYFFEVKCKCGKKYTLEKAKIVECKFNPECSTQCDFYKKTANSGKDIFNILFDNTYSSIQIFSDKGTKYYRLHSDPRDIINKKFGELTIKSIYGAKLKDINDFEIVYLCECSCGNTCHRDRSSLLKAKGTPMCDDHKKADPKMMEFLGKTINDLLIRRCTKTYNIYTYELLCRKCGTIYTATRDDIINYNIDHCKCCNTNNNGLRTVIRFRKDKLYEINK